MALGTLDRTPPPFFRQGPSGCQRVLLALALFPDGRRRTVPTPSRAGHLATMLNQMQRALLVPGRRSQGRAYMGGLADPSPPSRRPARPRRQSECDGGDLRSRRTPPETMLELRPRSQSAAGRELLRGSDPYCARSNRPRCQPKRRTRVAGITRGRARQGTRVTCNVGGHDARDRDAAIPSGTAAPGCAAPRSVAAPPACSRCG